MTDDIGKLVRKIVYPGLLAKLGSVLAALSIVALLREGFDLGLATPFAAFLGFYDQFTRVIFDPVATCMEALANWAGWNIELFAHWKHVFLLMSLYFFAGVRVEILGNRKWIGIAVRIALGFCLALATSILVGRVPLTSSNTLANLSTAAIPAFATFVNDVFLRGWRVCFQYSEIAGWFNRAPPSRLDYFLKGVGGISRRTVLCLVVILIGWYLPPVHWLGSPGLVLLGLVILVHALNLIHLGTEEIEWRRKEGDSVMTAFLRSRATLIGLQMFSVIFDTSVFVGGNAGWQFLILNAD